MNDLIHIIYASTANHHFTKEELIELLNTARNNNSQIDVTGLLLFHNDNFFQVLEGSKSVIETLFLKIKNDTRHESIVEIINERIVNRVFPDWSMGFKEVTTSDLKTLPGMNDFFEEKNSFNRLDSGRAKKILQAFANGEWQNNG